MYQPVIAHYAHSFPARARKIGSRRETRRMATVSLLPSKFSQRTEPAAFTRARGIWQETWNVLQHTRSENLGRRREEKRARSLTERVLKIPAKPEGLRANRTFVHVYRHTGIPYRVIHCSHCIALQLLYASYVIRVISYNLIRLSRTIVTKHGVHEYIHKYFKQWNVRMIMETIERILTWKSKRMHNCDRAGFFFFEEIRN